ncbi:12522_t:CDS:10 [Funneliformis geosporum]|uniref:15846_t:CDS:1 n=1 Tax=Funneliformis geosporum TaxID=1117311 RepID=A0A9W4SBZ2_9GLOM|nr:12522_t:CDS:10 [Funneliformis geosporum]CAI2162812.1 15846_t:CDS:10 [Funneliformis geosporum]
MNDNQTSGSGGFSLKSILSDEDHEAGSILLSLSNPNTAPLPQQSTPHYNQSRDYYPSKDIEQQMSDVEIAAATISSLSTISNSVKSIPQHQRQRAKSNSMSIASLLGGDEPASSDSGRSIPNGSLINEQSQQRYQQQHQESYPEEMRNGDIHSHHQGQHNLDYGLFNSSSNHNGIRKLAKRLSGGSAPLVVNTTTKIPQREPKGIQKKSPQKRRPSDAVDFSNTRPKVHRNPDLNYFPHGPPTTSGGPKLSDLKEQLGEERIQNRLISAVPNYPMEWDRGQHPQSLHQTRPSHSITTQTEMPNGNRFTNNLPLSMAKNVNSPPMHGDSQKLNVKNFLMSNNERQGNKTTSPPLPGLSAHVPNGYQHGHGVGVGGMVGTHVDITPQLSQQPPPQMPPIQNGMPAISGHHSAFSNQFHKKYQDMENNKSKDGHLQSQTPPPQNNNIMNRQIIPNGSPMNNDHVMVTQVNGNNIYGSRDGYPPIQPNNSGFMHSSEIAANSGVQQRRVSDPLMHPISNVNAISGSRNVYPNGPSLVEQPPPPHTPQRRSTGSSHNSPPIHSSSVQHSSSQRQNILSSLSEPSHRTSTPSTSRSVSQSSQHSYMPGPHDALTSRNSYEKTSPVPPPPTYIPGPHDSRNSYDKTPPAQTVYMPGPSRNSYIAKSSAPIPQSPAMNPSRQGPLANHYHNHSPSPGPPQSGSNRLSGIGMSPHHNLHSEPVCAPVNGPNGLSPSRRILEPQSQSSGYGSNNGHSHHLHSHLDVPPPAQVLGQSTRGAYY